MQHTPRTDRLQLPSLGDFMAVSRDLAGALRELSPCSAHTSEGMDVFPRERTCTLSDVCRVLWSIANVTGTSSFLDLHTHPVPRRGLGLVVGKHLWARCPTFLYFASLSQVEPNSERVSHPWKINHFGQRAKKKKKKKSLASF